MFENLNKLLESVSFRFKSIFSFKDMPIFASLIKTVLLLIFIVPFVVFELLGIFFALCSCIPIVGIIFNFTVCLICDLLSSLFFYLIMLPNKYSAKKTINTFIPKKVVNRIMLADDEYQDVYEVLIWCSGEVDENIENILNRYKNKLFLGYLSGQEAFQLQKILINIKTFSNDSIFISKLDKAISILEKHIYKH
ncbi:MAG: hypothetical protein HDT29_01335 [Clostridiales bacterium]|nr:hypothetical protein [Clostridiales bacterium]